MSDSQCFKVLSDQIWISHQCLLISKTDYFRLWFLYSKDLRISTFYRKELSKSNTFIFKPRKTTISFTLLLIGHYHLRMEVPSKIKIKNFKYKCINLLFCILLTVFRLKYSILWMKKITKLFWMKPS